MKELSSEFKDELIELSIAKIEDVYSLVFKERIN